MKLLQLTGLLGASLLTMGLSQSAFANGEYCESDDLQCIFGIAAESNICDSINLNEDGIAINSPFGGAYQIPQTGELSYWVFTNCKLKPPYPKP